VDDLRPAHERAQGQGIDQQAASVKGNVEEPTFPFRWFGTFRIRGCHGGVSPQAETYIWVPNG